MARTRRHYRGRYRYSGRRRALQHIEEARKLSEELGGSDEDVKQYFFSLSANELRPILDEYERKSGRQARDYAEQTLPKWRSRRVNMSGMVATRLFSLLPPRMPLSIKYGLVENLWRHYGPRSKTTLRVGLDADLDSVIDAVRQHIERVVVNYTIPENLERRFDWLSGGDVYVKQQLLNHFRQTEKLVVVEAVRLQVPVMLEHSRNDKSWYTHRFAQVLQIGKHELELLIDRKASKVSVLEPSPSTRSEWSRRIFHGGHRWLWWIAAGGALLYLFSR